MNDKDNPFDQASHDSPSILQRSAFRLPRFSFILHPPSFIFLFFLFLWLTSAYFYQSSQHNEAARFDQTRAIIEKGVLWIDDFAYYNTADVVQVARPGGPSHTFPNKAPGTSLLAVAPFWFWMHVLRWFHLPEWIYWHLVAYLTTLTTVSLLSALAAVAMYSILRRMTGNAAVSALAVAAIWLGTICFPFSTLFFSHQQAAAQLVIAFWLLFGLREDVKSPAAGELQETYSEEDEKGSLKAGLQTALAGFLCGFTIATEYPTALLVFFLCLYFGVIVLRFEGPARKRAALTAAFGAGLAGGLAILAAYNLAAFGKILYVPYESYAATAASPFPGHTAGYVGMHWPGWRNFLNVVAEITVRPQRGLLYIGFAKGMLGACSPVLWLALPGWIWFFIRRKEYRLEAALVAAMAAAYLTFNACYGDSIVYWGGACSVGPRHLIPMLPFLALPLADGARRLWFLFAPLLLISMFYMLLATAVEPRVPYEYRHPSQALFWDNYLRGHLALNPQGLFDRQKQPLTANSTAFNWGKAVGLPGTIQLAPLLVLWLALGGGLIWMSSSSRHPQSEIHNPQSANGNPQSQEPFAKPGERGHLARSLMQHSRGRDALLTGKMPALPCSAKGSRVSNSEIVNRKSKIVILVVWAVFLLVVAVAPPIHHWRVQRQLAVPDGGLLARYYPNMNWQGPPAFVQKDSEMAFDWTTDPPLPWQFSVEWTGALRIDRPGRYAFAVTSDDGSFLFLDGKEIVANGGSHGPRRITGMAEITRSGLYPLAIRYFNNQLGGVMRATWQSPGGEEEVLPRDALSLPRR